LKKTAVMQHLADAVKETIPLDHPLAFATVQSKPERACADYAVFVFGVKGRELFFREGKALYSWVLEIQPKHKRFGRIYLFLIAFRGLTRSLL
jgi:hypothetical protein